MESFAHTCYWYFCTLDGCRGYRFRIFLSFYLRYPLDSCISVCYNSYAEGVMMISQSHHNTEKGVLQPPFLFFCASSRETTLFFLLIESGLALCDLAHHDMPSFSASMVATLTAIRSMSLSGSGESGRWYTPLFA